MNKQPKQPSEKAYRAKADEVFLSKYRGRSCEVCEWRGDYGRTANTAGHHVLPKGSYRAVRYDRRNIVVVCPRHHMFDRRIAAHGASGFAVAAFMSGLRERRPDDYAFLSAVWRGVVTPAKSTYKQSFIALTEGAST